jgi:Glutathione-dependent formaldehyde-activating enzyme
MGRAWGIVGHTIKHFHRSVDGVQLDHMEFTGGCVCGGTRYVLKSRPLSVVDCHCIDCQKSAGAPYLTWGTMPRKDLILSKGEPRKIPLICFSKTAKTRTTSMSQLHRWTIRRHLRRRKRFSSKTNCHGLSSTNRFRRSRQSRRRSLTTNCRDFGWGG